MRRLVIDLKKSMLECQTTCQPCKKTPVFRTRDLNLNQKSSTALPNTRIWVLMKIKKSTKTQKIKFFTDVFINEFSKKNFFSLCTIFDVCIRKVIGFLKCY